MARHHEPYRIYRAALHLYPKAHREAYGEQILQTLEDILADQPNGFSRFVVWLRVICELPINVIQENSNNIGETGMSKLSKVTNKQLMYGALALLVVVGYIAMGIIWRHQRMQINALDAYVQTVSENQFATNGNGYNDVTIIPSEAAVYMPLAKLKLPATTPNEKLVYNYQEEHMVEGLKKVFPAELSISTHGLSTSNFSSTKQFDCSQVAYADFVTPSYPINPKWKLDGSVKLDDNRTMNIYYAPNVPGCDQAWKANKIDSKAIADSLLQAVSY